MRLRLTYNMRFNSDLLLTYAAKSSTAGFGFLVMILINRYSVEGVHTFGQITLIASSAGMLSTLLSARTGEAVTRFFVRENQSGHIGRAKFLLFIGMTIDSILALLVLGTIYALSGAISNSLLKSDDLAPLIAVYGLVTGFDMMMATPLSYFQSMKRFKTINLISTIRSILYPALLAYFFFIAHRNSLNEIILASVLSVGTIFILVYASFTFSVLAHFKGVKASYSRPLLLEYLRFNAITFLSTTIKAGNKSIDNLILGYYSSPEIVGVFQSIKRLTFPIMFVSSPFQLLYYPLIVKQHIDNRMMDMWYFILRICGKALLMSFGLSIGLVLLFKPAFQLMGVEVIPLYVKLLFVIIVLDLIQNSLWWVRSFSNAVNPKYSLIGNSLATLLQLTLVVFLSSSYGLAGFIAGQLSIALMLFYFWFTRLYKSSHL
jgi:O-antigen/teichoic acid export membrane protein